MPDKLSFNPHRALDTNGDPKGGALAYFFKTGTTTPVTVKDKAGLTLPWPLVADVSGTFAEVFYDGADAVKVIITDADGAVLPGYPVDPALRVAQNESAADAISFTPTALVPKTNVQLAIESVSTDLSDLEARTVTGAGLATGGGTLEASRVITVTAASNAEALAGASSSVAMTPLRVKEARVASNIGWGQSRLDVSASRAGNVSYQNTTGRPIEVNVLVTTTSAWQFQVSPNGSTWMPVAGNSTAATNISAIVPADHYYRFNAVVSFTYWTELR